MGIDVRDIPAEAAALLPDRLRAAGFEVEVGPVVDPSRPDRVGTRALCRRGRDVQRIGWCRIPGRPEICRVSIGNAWGWRASARRRLQAEVTAVIDQNGGCWPFPP